MFKTALTLETQRLHPLKRTSEWRHTKIKNMFCNVHISWWAVRLATSLLFLCLFWIRGHHARHTTMTVWQWLQHFFCSMDIFGLYQVSYLYIGFIGFCTTILVSLVISFIVGGSATVIIFLKLKWCWWKVRGIQLLRFNYVTLHVRLRRRQQATWRRPAHAHWLRRPLRLLPVAAQQREVRLRCRLWRRIWRRRRCWWWWWWEKGLHCTM